jgi:hypothetical protein
MEGPLVRGPFRRGPRGFRGRVAFARCASPAWLGGAAVAWRQLAPELQKEKHRWCPTAPDGHGERAYLSRQGQIGSIDSNFSRGVQRRPAALGARLEAARCDHVGRADVGPCGHALYPCGSKPAAVQAAGPDLPHLREPVRPSRPLFLPSFVPPSASPAAALRGFLSA